MDVRFIKARIMEKGLTQAALAPMLGMTEATLSLKLNGKSEFTRAEMLQMAEILGVDVADLFFRQGA